MHLGPFHKDQQYSFLSSRRLPNLTTKQKSTQWAHHCERNVITKSWSLGLPTQHQQDRQVSIPQRLAEKSLPFPAPPVDLLRAQRIGFYLGFQDFFSFTSFWPLVFTQLGSPIIFQKLDLISFGTKGMGPAWSELLLSDPGLGGSMVLFCKWVLDTIELFFWRSWVPSFYSFYFGPNPSSVHQPGIFECILYVMCCQLYVSHDFQ